MGCKYQIKFTSVDRSENEIAIAIHCDSGEILTKTGSGAQIGISGCSGKQITEKTKNVERRQGIAVSWVGNESPMVSASSYAGGNTSIVLWFRHGQDVEKLVR